MNNQESTHFPSVLKWVVGAVLLVIFAIYGEQLMGILFLVGIGIGAIVWLADFIWVCLGGESFVAKKVSVRKTKNRQNALQNASLKEYLKNKSPVIQRRTSTAVSKKSNSFNFLMKRVFFLGLFILTIVLVRKHLLIEPMFGLSFAVSLYYFGRLLYAMYKEKNMLSITRYLFVWSVLTIIFAAALPLENPFGWIFSIIFCVSSFFMGAISVLDGPENEDEKEKQAHLKKKTIYFNGQIRKVDLFAKKGTDGALDDIYLTAGGMLINKFCEPVDNRGIPIDDDGNPITESGKAPQEAVDPYEIDH